MYKELTPEEILAEKRKMFRQLGKEVGELAREQSVLTPCTRTNVTCVINLALETEQGFSSYCASNNLSETALRDMRIATHNYDHITYTLCEALPKEFHSTIYSMFKQDMTVASARANIRSARKLIEAVGSYQVKQDKALLQELEDEQTARVEAESIVEHYRDALYQATETCAIGNEEYLWIAELTIGGETIKSACEQVGIPFESYKTWKKRNPTLFTSLQHLVEENTKK